MGKTNVIVSRRNIIFMIVASYNNDIIFESEVLEPEMTSFVILHTCPTSKVDVPKMWTPILEWYVVRCGSK